MDFLESHIKQFVACKQAPKAPGCESILKPASVEAKTSFENNAENKLSSEHLSYYNWPYPRKHYV